MRNQEMKVEERYSDRTLYINEEKNLRVIVQQCNQNVGSRVKYFVTVADVDPETGNGRNGKTVATRCTYEQAMRIAREYYFQ